MKKLYLFMLVLLCTAVLTNAQQVEITGVGMYNKTTESLDVDDIDLVIEELQQFKPGINIKG